MRSIAKRVRESGVKDDGGLTPEQSAKLWDRLAGRARRLATSARTSEEVSAATRALADVERLRPKIEDGELARPGKAPTEFGRQILADMREPLPALPAPEPVALAPPPPEPEPTLSPGEQVAEEIRQRFEAMRAAEREPEPPLDPERHDSRSTGELPRARRKNADPGRDSARRFGFY